jgi:hypothetical protein
MNTEETNNSTPRARRPFRIGAGLIALLGLYSLWSSVSPILNGYLHGISSLLVGLIFTFEFGSIAIRGDGLWLYKANRFKRKAQNKAKDGTSQ